MNKTILLATFQLLLCLVCTRAFAQQPTLAWAQRYNGVDSTSDDAVAIAVDAEGNSYVTGNSAHNAATTVKYSPAGEQLWVAQFAQLGGFVNGIVVDNKGGVYVTGYSYGDDYDVHYATIRYDAATGKQTWAQKYNWPGGDFDVPKALAVDTKGGVYVTGFSKNGDTYDFATIRYEAATGKESWTQRYDGSKGGYDVAWAIAVDNAGGVYVTGSSDSTSTDLVTIRYDAATGQQTWTRRYNSPGDGSDGGIAVATDNKGNVYVTGDSEGHFATIRYNAKTGKQVWVKRYNEGDNSNETPRAIAVDHAGDIYVTGYSYGKTPLDYVTVRYTATGKESWTQRYDGPDSGTGDDVAVALALDNAGGVYVTGYSGNGTYYPCDDDSCTTPTFATVRYEAATGTQTWVQRYEGPQYDIGEDNYAWALAVDKAGSVYVAGSGFTKSSSYDYVTIRYAAISGEEIWTRRYKGVENSNDDAIAVAVDTEGNSYVTGTSSNRAVTIKYSPAGERLWVAQFGGQASAIALDNKGGIYVAGNSYSQATDDDYMTVRYDAASGEQVWASRYNGLDNDDDQVIAITVDNAGGVYVTGTSDYGYATIRYDAATGGQSWISRQEGHYGAGSQRDAIATAIAVDATGGVYVTGFSLNPAEEDPPSFLTVRYAAASGDMIWARRSPFGETTAIALDNQGGVYVTGSEIVYDFENNAPVANYYRTIRYDAATGEPTWDSRYKEGSQARAIVVDNAGGVYVAGYSATIRYDVATGKQIWASPFNGKANSYGAADVDVAMGIDKQGGIYVAGTRLGEDNSRIFNTVKYAAADGAPLWQMQTAGPQDAAVDMALDSEANVFVTGYSYSSDTGNDFLTIKYSQEEECPVLAATTISGYTTVSSGHSHTCYTITAPGATSFNWEITAPDGSAYTSFSGQGTSGIKVNWPDSPEVYKVSIAYAAGPSCSATTATKYVSVYDPKAGFVTGGGWSDSPTNKDYALMQEKGKAYWAFGARYKENKPGSSSASAPVEGTLLLVLESGYVFRATSMAEGSLVIAGERAYFTGAGTLTRRGAAGLETDKRNFAFLVSATDGQLKKPGENDKLRLQIRTIEQDGSPVVVVYDNQLGCGLPALDDHAEACQLIEKGAIVIHHQGIRSLSDLFATAAQPERDIQGLQVYPSLVSDKATVSFSLQAAGEYTLELYDRKGALVRKIASGTAQTGKSYEEALSVESMAKGLYLLRLTCGSSVQSAKLVVQR
ncbi:SBBP repeat-containing protein [Pontibacter liquoris]|uniref:SBBP repeat-containing protein n=1 Tax=Pontibacter liquoris TaxID=2905677 RepID=UPI001FA6AAB2|nr:SBBP repeat-containing protein [Pontibacter liquoris]